MTEFENRYNVYYSRCPQKRQPSSKQESFIAAQFDGESESSGYVQMEKLLDETISESSSDNQTFEEKDTPIHYVRDSKDQKNVPLLKKFISQVLKDLSLKWNKIS